MASVRSLSWATSPSAIVSPAPSSTRWPAASERKASSAPRGLGAPHRRSTGRGRGRRWRCPTAARRRSPAPPPCRSSGTASSSSRAAVPWPACTRGSSNGWISTAPVSATSCGHGLGAGLHGRARTRRCRAPAASVAAPLGGRHAPRHHDRARGCPACCAATRQRGGVVARAVGHHAPRGLVVGQQQHRVGGAAELEGAGGVEVLGLEVHPGAHPVVDRRRPQHRRRRHQRARCARPPPARRRTMGRRAHSRVA